MHQFNFRDQSKEDDFNDLSQNILFLEYLSYQIRRYNKKLAKGHITRTNEDGTKNNIKSTHSATKSKMNQHIDSGENEDRKELDEDIEYLDIAKDNSTVLEVSMPGFLIRITKLDGISKMSNNDKYYSVMVFYRYIRRRRTFKKGKDPIANEKYYNFGHGWVPSINIKDRELVASSFNTFIRNNLAVNSSTFMKTTLGSKQRKKILKQTKRAELELGDSNANALIQTYIHSKEMRSCKNSKNNALNISGLNSIQVAKSPFDYESPIKPDDINIRIPSRNGFHPGESSEYFENSESSIGRDEFHFLSNCSSIVDEPHSTLHNGRGNIEDEEAFFEDESSIPQPQEEVSEDEYVRRSNIRYQRHAQIKKKPSRRSSKHDQSSTTNYEDFFGKYSISSELPDENSKNQVEMGDSLERLKQQQSKSETEESYKTANQNNSEESDDSDEDSLDESSGSELISSEVSPEVTQKRKSKSMSSNKA